MPKILGHSCTGWHSACRSMEDSLMTLAETWLAEGMEKGIREGVQQGI